MPFIDANGELGECPSCADLAAVVKGHERTIHGLQIRIAGILGDADEKRRSYDRLDEIATLFDYWRKTCGHPRSRLQRADGTYDAARFDALKWALETYGPKNAAYAILGASRPNFEGGASEGKRGRKFDDLGEHIFDRAYNAERFITVGRRYAGVPPYDEVGRE
jgi:hypothetical protein